MKIKKSIPALHKELAKKLEECQSKYPAWQAKLHTEMNEFELGKLTDFVLNLQSKLGQPTDRIKMTVAGLVASNCGSYHYDSFVIDKGWKRVFMLSTDEYRLDIIDSGIDNTVEIWWIEAYKKNSGIGSMLIENILDAADEIGVNVKAIPVPIGNQTKGAYDRLRNWYEDREFERAKSPIDPSVTYFTK